MNVFEAFQRRISEINSQIAGIHEGIKARLPGIEHGIEVLETEVRESGIAVTPEGKEILAKLQEHKMELSRFKN